MSTVVAAVMTTVMVVAVMAAVMVVAVMAAVMMAAVMNVVAVVTAMMNVMAMVTTVAAMTAMMIVVAVAVAAVVMPAIPAFAAAKADADNECVADDVPAWAVPTIVVPTVGIAVPLVFDIAARRHDLRIDLRQRPAGIGRLRVALSDRPEAVLNDAVPGVGAAVDKSRLHASGFDLSAGVGTGRLGQGRQRQRHQAGEPD
jgi:hypothetical protein